MPRYLAISPKFVVPFERFVAFTFACTLVVAGMKTPNELMRPIHNRMPVILPREVEPVWLDQGITDSTFLKSLLVPYPEDQMIAYEVSTFVNSVKNNGHECLCPAGGRLS